jgi:hypothetical protein
MKIIKSLEVFGVVGLEKKNNQVLKNINLITIAFAV